MIKSKFAKITGLTVGLAMAFSLAPAAGAQTSADTIAALQAQINALMAQLAALQGGTSVNQSYTFTQNLTIGATGGDVVSLQQFLVGKGFLNMPVGVAYGYFGPLTRSAVAAWQAANGISPAVGYWGPISRAAANTVAGPGVVTGPTVPVAAPGITTPGIEGDLVVTQNPTPVTGVKVFEGDSRKAVLGMRVEARTSDLRVERVTVRLPASTSFYTRVADRIYIMDGSTVLGSADLNSSTVIRNGSLYDISIFGMNYIVPKDTTRVLTVAFDFKSSIDSTYRANCGASCVVSVQLDGIRAVDGAGINQTAPKSGVTVSNTFSIEADSALSAALKLSLNVNSPKKAEVVADEGTDNNELSGLELLRFDVKAEKDMVRITDLTATTSRTNTALGADMSIVYLYDGNTLIGSAAPVATGSDVRVTTFTNIDYVVSKDSTRTLTIKADIINATTTVRAFTTSVVAAGITAENSLGDTPNSITGSATGQEISVLSVGPQITLGSRNLVKTKSIAFTTDTAAATASFNITLKAVGGDIYFDGATASSTFGFQLYKNGVDDTPAIASSTVAINWNAPAGTATYGTNGFILSEGQTVTVPVEYVISVNSDFAFGSYSVGLLHVKWTASAGGTAATTEFMAGLLDWRTNTIILP
jgi:peptidoglycan hydrolase-like protein with peptidoglycan-binding domain